MSESQDTLALISEETGKDLANSEKLLEFWEKKAEDRQKSDRFAGTWPIAVSAVWNSEFRRSPSPSGSRS